MNVLIDDDKLIHISWTLRAQASQQRLLCFYSVSDFLNEASSISRTSKIYIDSELGKGVKGELESVKLLKLGFENLFLCTGYNDIDIKLFPWLKNITSKKPPF